MKLNEQAYPIEQNHKLVNLFFPLASGKHSLFISPCIFKWCVKQYNFTCPLALRLDALCATVAVFAGGTGEDTSASHRNLLGRLTFGAFIFTRAHLAPVHTFLSVPFEMSMFQYFQSPFLVHFWVFELAG